jgi:hypothetical protein
MQCPGKPEKISYMPDGKRKGKTHTRTKIADISEHKKNQKQRNNGRGN